MSSVITVRKARWGWWVDGRWCPTRNIRDHQIKMVRERTGKRDHQITMVRKRTGKTHKNARTSKRVSALTVIQHRSRSLAWKRVSLDIVGGEIPALARPGELVRVSADNIGGGEIEGILVEAYDAGNGRAHIVLIADDDEAERAFPGVCS